MLEKIQKLADGRWQATVVMASPAITFVVSGRSKLHAEVLATQLITDQAAHRAAGRR